MAWLFVYLIVIAIVITVVRQVHAGYDLRGETKDFFELTKWDGTTPVLHSRYLPEWLYYLPAWVVCQWYAALKYCWLNRKYYLGGGKTLRLKYAKRVLADTIIRYDEHLRRYKIGEERKLFPGWRPEDGPGDEFSYLAPPTTDHPYAAGRKFYWDAVDVYAGGPLDAFVADLIRTPLQFWGLVFLSASQLLLWPVTVCTRCLWEYLVIVIPVMRFMVIQPLIFFFSGFKNPMDQSIQNESRIIHDDCRKSHDWAIMQPNAHIQTLMPCGHLAHKSQHICGDCAQKYKKCLWCGYKVKRRKVRSRS